MSSAVQGSSDAQTRNQAAEQKLFSLTEPDITRPLSASSSVSRSSSLTKASADENFGLDDRFIAEIMMSLDSEKLEALRRAFEQNDDDGLSLAEFVHVMTSILNMNHLMTEEQFAANLIEFFDQVDINGDGSMEWEEFTSFIVEMGMSEDDHQPNAISKYFHAGVKETGNQNLYVECIRSFANDTVGVCDVDCQSVQIFTANFDFIGTIKYNSGAIHCVDYIPEHDMYVISATDLTISFFDAQNLNFMKQFGTPSQNTTTMRWVSGQGLLYTGDTKGVIRFWDVFDMEEVGTLGNEGQLHGYSHEHAHGKHHRTTGTHKDIILDMIELSGLDRLASASIDRTIKLWDLTTGKLRRTLNGHAKGVRRIAYSPEWKVLVSVGFDFDVLVWNPYVAHLILRMQDHGCSLCGVEIVPNTPILVTADVQGNVKVWDVRNLSPVQTIKAEEKMNGQLKSIVTIPSTKRIVAVGRCMHFFDYEKIERPELTDELPLICALYNPTTFTFITVSVKFVKIWDANTGKVTRVYRNLSTTDITSMCLDFRQRKFILGDHDGYLRCFDFLNGAEMKEFSYEETSDKAHLDEISRLVYCDEHATVVSVSWDRSICIHDEVEAEEGVLLRKIENSHRRDITALAYSHNLSLIATGSNDSALKIWDYEFARLEANLIGHTSAITCVLFLDPFPALISCDVGGNIIMWATRPSRSKNKVVTRWKHRPASKGGGKPIAAAITSLTTSWQFEKKRQETRHSSTGREMDRRNIQRGDTLDVLQEEQGEEKGGEAKDGEEVKPYSTESFVETSLQSSEAAQQWMERLKKLSKNRQKKGSGEDEDGQNFQEFLLYAGDERGNVIIWNMLPTFQSLMQEYGKTSQGMGPVEIPVECGNPRRHITYDAGLGTTEESAKGSGRSTGVATVGAGEDGTVMSADVVSVVHTWKAHTDAINSLQIIEDPKSLITCSNDRLAKLWARNGKGLGVLRQGGPMKGERWCFDIDQKGIAEGKLEAGGTLMEEVKEMDALELEESSDEDDMSSTLSMPKIDVLAISRRGGRDEPEYKALKGRRTPRRVPVTPMTVGKRRRAVDKDRNRYK